MLKEVLHYLSIKNDGTYIDCTFGSGGHSIEIVKKLSERGKLFLLDWDCETVKYYREKFSRYKNTKWICENFANLNSVVKKTGIKNIDGFLFDLGFSFLQIEDRTRGFSFNFAAPLDMRYNKDNLLTAKEVINSYSKKELQGILKEFADEQFAEKIADGICRYRLKKKIETTKELIEVIKTATPVWYHNKKGGRIHFATKTFQALRIAVNNELDNIKKGISSAIKLVSSGGRIVVLSYHSIEHRLLKNIFRDAERNQLIKLVVKKPVFPSANEIFLNPRSRSAQLRIIEKR